MVSLALQDAYFRYPPQVWTIDSSWTLQNSSLVYLVMEIRSLPCMARPPPDESAISCDYSRSFCQPHLLQRPSGVSFLGHLSSLYFLVPDGMFRMRLLQPCLQDQWDFLDDQFQVSWFPLCREFFFSDGLEWPSCVKEYPSLLQSKKSTSYQTLRMWVAGPHRRTPHLGPFVSSSEDSLHQPERASSSSVRPDGLRTPVGRPVGSSVLRQHHHSNVCPSPASFIMGSSNVSADALRRPIW